MDFKHEFILKRRLTKKYLLERIEKQYLEEYQIRQKLINDLKRKPPELEEKEIVNGINVLRNNKLMNDAKNNEKVQINNLIQQLMSKNFYSGNVTYNRNSAYAKAKKMRKNTSHDNFLL